MSVRYLIDENLPPRLATALLRLDPAIDVLRVGDPGAPARGTLDPDILRYLQTAQRLLVTENRVSMPGHVRDHLAAGNHHWAYFASVHAQLYGVSPRSCTSFGRRAKPKSGGMSSCGSRYSILPLSARSTA